MLSFRWIAISLVLLGWFVYYPIVDNIIVSFHESGHLHRRDRPIVGMANYTRLFHDPMVWHALWNNCLVRGALDRVPGVRRLRAGRGDRGRAQRPVARGFWRAVYFVPSAISITVTGLLFYFIYQPQTAAC